LSALIAASGFIPEFISTAKETDDQFSFRAIGASSCEEMIRRSVSWLSDRAQNLERDGCPAPIHFAPGLKTNNSARSG
jgi:hypothetical protein